MPTQAAVQAYYGQELTGTADLKTSACCDADAVPDWLRPLLREFWRDLNGSTRTPIRSRLGFHEPRQTAGEEVP